MSGYPLPTEEQVEQYTLDLTNYSAMKEVDLQHLTKTAAWFDQANPQK